VAMDARRLWAAWRDRAALARHEPPNVFSPAPASSEKAT